MTPTVGSAIQAFIASSIGLVLLGGALDKARHRARFVAAVRDYQIVPDPLAASAAAVVATTEGLAGLLLLLPTTRNSGAAAAAMLILLFAGAIALNLLRGRRNIDCGCDLTHPGRPISWRLVARNLGLATLAVLTLSSDRPVMAVWWLSLFAAVLAYGLLLCLRLLSSFSLAARVTEAS